MFLLNQLRYKKSSHRETFIEWKINVSIFLFTANVVSEDAILKWFKDGHSQKGKMHFLEQMKKFIEWLQNAEEGKRNRIVVI